MDSVECVASAGDGHRFLSGGWDGGILLWDARDAGTAPKPEPKKRRAGDAAAASAAAATVHAVTRFVGHRGAVTAVTWPHPAAIYSGSWDHTVVRWDAASQASVSTWNAGSVVSDLAFSILANAIATAHHDGTIRIWDPRTSEQENLRQTLRSHTGWATAVDWSPSSPFLLASTAHDGTVKLWDTRARSPLHSLAQHAGPGGAVEKGLCLAWLDASHALSGGSDKRLRAFVLSDARAEEQREPVAEAAAARGDAAEMRDEESVPARPARKRRQPKP
jgi:ribosome biogenesis protein YTM1